MDRRNFVIGSGASLAAATWGPAVAGVPGRQDAARIETRETTGALPHVWEESVGSDRAAITLREQWRQDFRQGVREAGFKRARFHGIFADELGVWGGSTVERVRRGGANWQNVFRVYDGLVDAGAAPFVELSFTPSHLASGKQQFGFYGGNITPPQSDEEYGAFIRSFVEALVGRYGLDRVRQWPFEVWNEPNLTFFWTGDKQRYFTMYKAAATAIKGVDERLQVGGPATSAGAWVADFAAWCSANNAPVDFFATHAYAGDVSADTASLSINDRIPARIRDVRRQIDAGGHAGKPLWLSEWSSDSPAMIAHVISQCLPYCAGMSQWVLSGIYEELGPDDYILKEGSMGWSMLIDGIAKPSFNTYRLLHRLGHQRLRGTGPVLAARGPNGRPAALVWNLAEVAQPGGIPGMTAERKISGSAVRLAGEFAGARPGSIARVTYVDWERGSPMPAWRAMGSPKYLSREQVVALRRAAEPLTEIRRLDRGSTVTLDLPPEGVALVELT